MIKITVTLITSRTQQDQAWIHEGHHAARWGGAALWLGRSVDAGVGPVTSLNTVRLPGVLACRGGARPRGGESMRVVDAGE